MTKVLVLPELVDLNTYITAERRNRFIGAKIKKEMTELVAYACLVQKVPKMARITRFELVWYHCNKRKDFDNVEFGVKWIKDGMVMAGVIENDGWKHFPPRTVHDHEVSPRSGVDVIIEYV